MGRQIKNFDKVTVRLLREELQKAVQSVMDFYGVEVEFGNAKFSLHHIKFQVKVDTRNENGEVITKEAEHFTRYANMYGLLTTDLGRVFKHNGLEFKIVGLNVTRNAKYRIETLGVSNGKNYRFQAEHVKRLLEAQKPNPEPEAPKSRLNRRGQ